MSIENLTIADIKELFSMIETIRGASAQNTATAANNNTIDGFALGKPVIIRTLSAGVWCGYLAQKSKNEVVLTQARRMWWWHCMESISLSGVVVSGIDQSKSKIAPAVEQVWLEAIEIMPISGEAAKSVLEAPVVQASK